jgi:hypothetical protein
MYSVEPCVLAPYLTLDDFLIFIKVNTEWKTWIEGNLNTLSLWNGLPFVSSDKEVIPFCQSILIGKTLISSLPYLRRPSRFIELYATSFWSANKLLRYANQNNDTRLISEAKKRYACNTRDQPFPISYTADDGYKTHSLKRFKKYINTINSIELEDVLHMHCCYESYEIAIYILETYPSDNYFVHPEFITFCQENDLVFNVSSYHVKLVMEQTNCSKDEAIAALNLKNGDVVDAIIHLTIV